MTRTYTILLIFAFNTSLIFSQNPEDFIPKDAITVFSIHKFDKIQNMSLEKLMSYEFMSELEQEQYDGSTSGKKLKNSGLDLSKKMRVFSGRNKNTRKVLPRATKGGRGTSKTRAKHEFLQFIGVFTRFWPSGWRGVQRERGVGGIGKPIPTGSNTPDQRSADLKFEMY